MESYVIRVYRRHESDPERVVGLVEHPENGTVERFSGVAELMKILLSPPQTTAAAPSITLKQTNASYTPDDVVPTANRHKMLRFRGQ